VLFPTIITFVSASLVLAFTPGPDNIFVLTQSALHGWREGIIVTLGLCAGLIVHTAAVALGAAVIFQQSDAAFTALKIAGTVYLLYLAYGAFRAGPAVLKVEADRAQPYLKMFCRGIVMNVTNPKIAIFFLAFLPQFTDADQGSIERQIVTLGLLFIASAFVAFSCISILAGTISERLLRSNRAQIMLNKFAGAVFVGLSVKLAISGR
jgi:threonine/homoserine/homoserine lactone efflux protein